MCEMKTEKCEMKYEIDSIKNDRCEIKYETAKCEMRCAK